MTCLPSLLGNLGNRQPLVLILHGRVVNLAGDELGQLAKQEVTRLGAGVVLFAHDLAQARVGQLDALFLNRSGRRLAPRLAVVKQVPVLEGDAVGGAGGCRLSEDLGALLVGFGQPAQLSPVDIRIFVIDGNGVEQDRTAALFGQQGVEIEVVVHAGPGIIDSDRRAG